MALYFSSVLNMHVFYPVIPVAISAHYADFLCMAVFVKITHFMNKGTNSCMFCECGSMCL